MTPFYATVRGWSRLERAVAAGVLALIWIPLVVKAVRNALDGSDLAILLEAARAVARGESPYGEGSAYMYPPLCAFLMVPLAFLPVGVAALLWALAKALLCHGAAAALLPADGQAGLGARRRAWAILLAPVAIYRFLESDLVTGNTNVFLLAGLVGTLALLERRRSLLAGALLALVAAVKLAPIYVAGGLACAGRWRVALACGACLLLFLIGPTLLVTGGLRSGWAGFATNSAAVFGVSDESLEETGASGYLPGQSLRPLLHRALTPIDATAHDRRIVRLNLVAWTPATVEWLYRVLAGLGAVAGWWICRGRSPTWVVAWCALLLLLLAPYARKAHFVLLLPAYLLILRQLLAGWRPRWALGLIALSLVLGQLTTPAIWGRSTAAVIIGAGAIGWAAIVLVPVLFALRTSPGLPPTLTGAPRAPGG